MSSKIKYLLEENKIPNYGWDVASYGTEYTGPDPYKKSHAKYSPGKNSN